MYKWLHTVLCIFAVTPHAGVRIEMLDAQLSYLTVESPPTRGCELKFTSKQITIPNVVTPHAGVRIEMERRADADSSRGHPPRGGAN